MAIRGSGGFVLMVTAAMLAWGCGTTAPSRFYTLSATATPDGAPALDVAVMVGSVSIPSAVDRPEIVTRVAPNRVAIDEFNRWASPIGEDIGRTIAADLVILLGSRTIGTAPFATFDPDYRVSINVQRFESVPGEAVVVEAVWVVRQTAGGSTRSGASAAREVVESPDFDALAAAHSRALAKLSADIAESIRAEAGVR